MWSLLLDPKADAVLNVVIFGALLTWAWQRYRATSESSRDRRHHWRRQENCLREMGAKIETHADEIRDLKARIEPLQARIKLLESSLKPQSKTQQAHEPER